MGTCEHLTKATDSPEPPAQTAAGCTGCLSEGRQDWVHLRLCLDCGYVGCCDSSPANHATRHYQDTEHPVMRSREKGEDWRWCFPDELVG
ncbi:MAG: UBP-type zinc finger domain-containing protein [Actinocatenispora sp.]